MAEVDYSGLLPALRFHLRENGGAEGCACAEDGCAAFSEEELLALLEKHGGNLRAAAYEGLVRKAEDDSIRLPDGLELPGNGAYWLGLARMYRPCAARNLPRADEVFDNEHE